MAITQSQVIDIMYNAVTAAISKHLIPHLGQVLKD
jgi:hypothetical protein